MIIGSWTDYDVLGVVLYCSGCKVMTYGGLPVAKELEGSLVFSRGITAWCG